MSITYIKATEKDIGLILEFIKKLAEYEKLSHEVSATEKQLKKTLFSKQPLAHVVFAKNEETIAGFALYFFKYSTFLAQPTLHLEDLFVLPEHRGKALGKGLILHLSNLALEQNCGRMEWDVLDWNKSAIDFYNSLGAEPLKEWFTYRLSKEAMSRLSV